MSQVFYKSKKKSRMYDKTSGKCGEITFCLQLSKRVYALNCLFCPQICIQWEAFISHIEEEHDEELQPDHLQDIEEIYVDANNSKDNAPKQSPVSFQKELPRSGRIRVRAGLEGSTSAEALLNSHDHLMGKEAGCRVVNAAILDQTCDSIDEQKTFDSILSLSEMDSDLDVTNAQQNFIIQPDKLTPIFTNISYIGTADFVHQLPSTQEIKRILELQPLFKVDVLENRHRIKLAKELIGFILKKQPDRRMVKEDFLQLAQSIVDIFPSEVLETYYVPYKTGHTAKGKLFDAYFNTRQKLGDAGLIKRRSKAKPEERMGNGDACENESIADIGDSDLNILKSGCSDWDLVLATWRKTHSFRQRELKNPNLKTQEYIEKYSVILHENNYDLFDMDFKLLYPTAKNIYEWKLYYRKIMTKAEKINERAGLREILKQIEETEEEDSKLALSLMLIAYILPNARQTTKLEIQESFISYCKDITEADDESKRSKRIKLEDEPKVYLIGDSSKTICGAFVDICGKRLKFKNPLKAIEFCFYSFMVMNMKYPKYVKQVWMFIQKLIYEVHTPWDTVMPAINTLINDLRLDKFR